MKGDFSRIRFNAAKLYTAVLKQQGRVDLDSDAIEQCAIDVTLRETANADIIGAYGGPVDGAGFAISVEGEEIWISAGRYYVQGILVEIPNRVHYDRQPYLIDPTHRAKELLESLGEPGDGSYLQFELEVWQRMATALDDPCLLEPALNQADTTTRLQTVWRVVGTLQPGTDLKLVGNAGEMGASLSGGGSGCGCQPIPAAGYQGLENQLYRVEIHQSGDLTSAFFKWSRENGSVVTQVTAVSGKTVTVTSLGPDANLGYQVGQWVELSDDTEQFATPAPNQPGTLYQIFSVDQAALQVTMTTAVVGLHVHKNARMRRWDQSGASATASGIPVSNTPIPLENGIEVNFSKGNFQAGDYWTIPARTANGSIDWPPCGGNGKHFQAASSMQVYDAPLACVSRVSIKTAGLIEIKIAVFDQRSFFSPMSASAIHVEDISWSNADLLTLDQFLDKGLSLTLDAAPTSRLDAAVFRVSLEVGGLTSFRQGFDNALTTRMEVNKTINVNTDGAEINVNAGLSGARATAKPGFRVGPALRQEYVLDGIVDLTGPELAGWVMNWNFPVKVDQGDLVYELNSMLAYASERITGNNNQLSKIPAARVRVRVFGHAVFAEASTGCGPVKIIYLDGQCFGETGKLSDGSTGVALETPSGGGVIASDFESWFYLAPSADVESVEFNPETINLGVGAEAAAKGLSDSGTTTGTVTLNTPVASDTTIDLTVSSQTGVTLTFSSTSIVIAAGQTSQTFTATIQATTAAPNGSVTLTVTATPQLETPGLGQILSATGELYVTVSNPVAISTTSLPAGVVGKAYSTTLAATGGTPSYKWSLVAGASGLPSGLTLSAAGVISGTPTTAGTDSFTVEVADSASTPSTATKQFSIEVYAALEITTKSPLPGGYQQATYRTQLEATGGKPPYKWEKTAGSLPSGCTLDAADGVISGTTNGSGESQFAIEVTDSASPADHASRNFVIDVEAAPK